MEWNSVLVIRHTLKEQNSDFKVKVDITMRYHFPYETIYGWTVLHTHT